MSESSPALAGTFAPVGRYSVAVLAAIVGIVISIAAYIFVGQFNRQLAEGNFAKAAQNQRSAIQLELGNYDEAVAALTTFFDASNDDLSVAQFDLFANFLRQRFPGIGSLIWSPRVTQDQRAAFVAKVRAAGIPDYEILDYAANGSPMPAILRDEYYAKLFGTLNPGFGNPVGFDALSDPTRAPILRQARDTGQPRAVGPLPSHTQGSTVAVPAYVVFSPVYRRDLPHGTVGERRIANTGVVIGVVRIQEALAAIRQELGGTLSLDFYFFYPGGPLDGRQLYWTSPRDASDGAQAPSESQLRADTHWEGTLNLFDQKIGLLVVPSRTLAGGLFGSEAMPTLAIGLIMTALMAAYLFGIARRAGRLERLTTRLQETSKELGFSNVLLTAATENSPDGILVVNTEHRAILRNAPFRKMWDVPPDTAIPDDRMQLLHSVVAKVKNPDEFMAHISHLQANPREIEHSEFDVKDGRVIDRYTRSLFDDHENYLGRIWFFSDVTERVRAEKAQEYRGNLLHAVAAAASELLSKPSLAEAVPRAFAIVGEAVGAHRVIAIEEHADKSGVFSPHLRYAWHSPEAPTILEEASFGGGASFGERLRKFLAPLQSGGSIQATRRDPGDAEELLEKLQTASILILPVAVDGKYWGRIGFDDCINQREWKSIEIDMLATLADLVGASIARTRHLKALAEADTIIEHSPVILYRLAPESPFQMTYVSRNITQLGYEPATLLQSPNAISSLFYPEDLAKTRVNLGQLSAAKSAVARLLWRMRKSDGTPRWFENQLFPIRDAQGQLAAIEGIAVDVTDRIGVEQTLQRYNSLLDAVTKSVATLLTEKSVAEAVPIALAYIGDAIKEFQILVVRRVRDADGLPRLKVAFEWSRADAPQRDAGRTLADVRLDIPDIAAWYAPLAERKTVVTKIETANATVKDLMLGMGAQSLLFVPIFTDAICWGHLSLEGTSPNQVWDDAEIALLQTLGNLIGAAIARERRAKALSDANRIVENSSAILFRFLATPSMPMIFVSANVKRYGYDPARIIAEPNYYKSMVHPDDVGKVQVWWQQILDEKSQENNLEFRLRTGDGAYRWMEVHYNPIKDSSGKLIEVEGILVDLTEHKEAEATIALLARTDALTGLANRRTFMERLDQAFAATRRGGNPFAVLSLDLDRFKEVNDTLGHPGGDLLLRAVSERLRNAVRETDMVARFGGDEFMILQTDVTEAAAAGALGEKIRGVIAVPYVLGSNSVQVTASIGIATFSADVGSAEAIIDQADVALYRAKEEGRDRYRFHSDEMTTEVRERIAMTEDLRKALVGNELELDYQPLVELASGRVFGMEALVRWNRPLHGRLEPDTFLPIAERTGMIVQLGHWVLRQACRQMKAWQVAGIALPTMTINLSLAQLKTGDALIEDVTATLAEFGVAPSSVEFDVMEAMLAGLTSAQSSVLERLHELGVKIALDDFGSELSSLNYLRKYHVDHLKICRPFVQTATTDVRSASTIRAIVRLAGDLKIGVIAEGVETPEQRKLLMSLSAQTSAQGFLFSRPLTADGATDVLRRKVIGPPAPPTRVEAIVVTAVPEAV